MEFINDINGETLIICNNSLKQEILKAKLLLPIKFMNMEEFLHNYLFTYNELAILYLMDKHGMKYDVAKDYLELLIYIEDKSYNTSKLDYLVHLKKELLSLNLLIFNNNFREYAKRVKIIIVDQVINDYILKVFKGLNYQIIVRKYHEYAHSVLEFDTMEEEVHYVAHEISSLLDSGVPIHKIKLTNVGEEYYNTIERIFALYNLKVNINYQILLINYQLVRDFISYYQELDLETALEKVANESDIYNELVNVINKYLKYHNKNLLIHKIKTSYLVNQKYTNSIDIINYLEYIPSDCEYIFMLSFNDGIIPKYSMDDNYITDNIVPLVGLNTTKELNDHIYNKTLSCIKNIKNIVITYKLRDFKSSYYKSILCQNFKVIKGDVSNSVSYSEIYDKMLLTKCYDEYYKYGVKSQKFSLLRNNYQINYNGYSNKYTKIMRQMDKLTLSYSKMQIYNKCAFRYYLTDILKLDVFEENFSTVIGSMVHYVLQKCLENNNYNIDIYVDEFLGDRVFTKKERFFLQKYKEAIRELLDQIMLEKEYSLFNQALYEKRIDIDFGNDIHFVGFIDKVLYYIDNDTTYVALIDYKTGIDDISLKYLKYGLNIQLPIYLYLSTKLDLNNIRYSGFYLQKFNLLNKDYRLVGYSNADHQALRVIDKNFANSKIIKGLKLNNDGSFSKNSKVLSDEEINDIKDEVVIQINKVIDSIKNNCFDINPKVSEGKNIGCEYCKFKDICFVTKKDEVNIDTMISGGDE